MKRVYLFLVVMQMLIMNLRVRTASHLPQCSTNSFIREYKKMRTEYQALLIKKSDANLQIKI